MELRHGRVIANGIEFAYLETGSGPLALCLHGFPDSPHTYRHLMPALAEAGYRAVAPFMRGYAPTAIPADGEFTTSVLMQDANALHEALGGDGEAVIIAHDWGVAGGWGAPVHAPDRWRKVVIANIPPMAVFGAVALTPDGLHRGFHYWFLQLAIADGLVAADDFAFIEHLWALWSPGYDAGDDLPHAKDCLRDPANLAAALGYYRHTFNPATFGTEAWSDEQAGVWGTIPSQPVLYLHGSRDGVTALDDDGVAQVGALLSKGSEAVMIRDAGHFLIAEQPGQVNGRIIHFLETEV
jgi:pimeloyl-ACP methyl ester carboxylesterase